MSKFLGASLSFNNQWTTITSVKDRDSSVVAWVFECGCGHNSTYKETQFTDPYSAAVTAMEFHQCNL